MQEPFSRVIRVDALPKDGQTITIEATPSEREALAAFYKLPSIESLTGTLSLSRSASGDVRATGAVHAELTQTCVVTLEPFPAAVDEEIDVRFAPAKDGDASHEHGEEPETYSIADEDAPDPIVDGKIDIGALAAEFFALGLDPYPRKPGVTFEQPGDVHATVSPFAALGNQAPKKPD
jgi:hypothetical protein